MLGTTIALPLHPPRTCACHFVVMLVIHRGISLPAVGETALDLGGSLVDHGSASLFIGDMLLLCGSAEAALHHAECRGRAESCR